MKSLTEHYVAALSAAHLISTTFPMILINGNKVHGREHFNANIDLTVVHGAPPSLFWIGLWKFGNANQWDLKWSFRASWFGVLVKATVISDFNIIFCFASFYK